MGASYRIQERFAQHANASTRLGKDIRKIGKSQFEFKILERCRRIQLAKKEHFWIEKLRPQYNRQISCFDPRPVVVQVKRTVYRTLKAVAKAEQEPTVNSLLATVATALAERFKRKTKQHERANDRISD